MATTTAAAPTAKAKKTKTNVASGAAEVTETLKKRALRRRLKAAGRKKLDAKLKTDKEFSKTYFAARSTRSTAKKAAFRKKKSKKK
jgi:predicted Holliday junction resolvase-like endonuclease